MLPLPSCIAYVIRDPLPPTRADVLTLFGQQMPRYGIGTVLIGQSAGSEPGTSKSGTSEPGTSKSGTSEPDASAHDISQPGASEPVSAPWSGGAMHIVGSLADRFASVLAPFWDAFGLYRAWRAGPLHAIQVRDKIASALLGRFAAAILGIPFFYWMSFPIVEGYAVRRDELARRGRRLRWLGHALRAALSRIVLYRLVLPAAHHVFVQSDAMAAWLAGHGVERSRSSAVPMGVDLKLFDRASVLPAADPRLDGRRVLVYLGRIAQSRNSSFLLDVVEHLAPAQPQILLVIAGDAPSADEMAWMRAEIERRHLARYVLLTGWLPQRVALGYAVRAEVGLSPIPRGILFDVSSPTKLVEYLALGIPSVANDIPDQQLVVSQSGAGLIAPMEPAPFAAAVNAAPAKRAVTDT